MWGMHPKKPHTIQTKDWNSVGKTVLGMNNWNWFLITSLQVTFPSHVHAVWSCANSQIKHEYLPPVTLVTVSCSANCCFPFDAFSQTLEVIFSNYVWFAIPLSSWLLQKASLHPLPTRRASSSFMRENIQTHLYTVTHTWSPQLLSHPVCPFHTSFHSISPINSRLFSSYYWQQKQRQKLSSITQLLPTYCLSLSLLHTPYLHSTQLTLHYSIHCTSAGVSIRLYQRQVQIPTPSKTTLGITW